MILPRKLTTLPTRPFAPGTLVSGQCAVDPGGFVARCKVGKGRVTIVADADFLNVEGPGAIDGPTDHNLDGLLDELAALDP